MSSDRRTKQRRAAKIEIFVLHYLRDYNAARAARAAGFAPASAAETAYALLQDPKVQAAIEVKQAELRAKLELDLQHVLRELHRIAFSRIDDVIIIEGGRPRVFDTIDIPERAWPAVREVVRGADGSVRVKMHDKTQALVVLGKHLGLKDTQRHEHTGPDGQPLQPAPAAVIHYHLPGAPRWKAKPPAAASKPEDDR